MVTVHIPAPMRSVTGGESEVKVDGVTLSEIVDALDAAHPGIRARLVEGDRIRGNLAVFVNSEQVSGSIRTRVPEDADIYFMPAIAGGKDSPQRTQSTQRFG